MHAGGSAVPTPFSVGFGGYMCPAAHFCPPGSTHELPCPAGQFNPTQGLAACRACPVVRRAPRCSVQCVRGHAPPRPLPHPTTKGRCVRWRERVPGGVSAAVLLPGGVDCAHYLPQRDRGAEHGAGCAPSPPLPAYLPPPPCLILTRVGCQVRRSSAISAPRAACARPGTSAARARRVLCAGSATACRTRVWGSHRAASRARRGATA